jgi:hypothetical protein
MEVQLHAFLNPATDEVTVSSLVHTLGKEPLVPTEKEPRWAHEPIWILLRAEKPFALARSTIPIHWPCSQAAHCNIKDTKARRVRAGRLFMTRK